MKKFLSILLAVSLVITSAVIAVNAAGNPAFSLSNVEAKPGETVLVDLKIENNPGIAALSVDIGYDASVLELTAVDSANLLGAVSTSPLDKNPVTISWYEAASKNRTESGTFATLTFKVVGNTAKTSALTIDYDPDNVADIDEKNVSFDKKNGSVKVNAEQASTEPYYPTEPQTPTEPATYAPPVSDGYTIYLQNEVTIDDGYESAWYAYSWNSKGDEKFVSGTKKFTVPYENVLFLRVRLSYKEDFEAAIKSGNSPWDIGVTHQTTDLNAALWNNETYRIYAIASYSYGSKTALEGEWLWSTEEPSTTPVTTQPAGTTPVTTQPSKSDSQTPADTSDDDYDDNDDDYWGTYDDDDDDDYTPASTTKKKTTKKKNTIKVTVKKKTVKAKKLKKKAQTIKPITVKKAKGKVTYKLVKKGTTKKIWKYLKISKKGKITIKKWKKAKKGTYKIKVKITAKGNKSYKSKTITKTFKVRIK